MLLRNYILNSVGHKIDFDIRFKFYNHVFYLSQKFFDEKKVGELKNHFNDITAVQDVVRNVILNLGTDIISVTVYFIIIFMMSWKLSLLIILLLPLYYINLKFLNKNIRKYDKEEWKTVSEIDSLNYETFSGIRVVKAFAIEKKILNMLKKLVMLRRIVRMKVLSYGSIMFSIGDILNTLGAVLVLWFGTMLAISNEMSIGSVLAYMSLLGYIQGPLTRLIDINYSIQSAANAADRFYHIFNMKSEAQTLKRSNEFITFNGEVVFDNISFSYDGSRSVLKNINLKVNPGETIAFVGKSGSGKSTLSNLIPLFYSGYEGSILIDGKDTRDLLLSNLRRSIGIVPQSTFLFSGSIEENILLGYRGKSDQVKFKEACEAAHVDDFVKSLPEGYQTKIGERGVRLSGGQQQRLAIARMLIINPKILILDEATSSLDLESETLIQAALEKLLINRTSFIIAHRLSTIINADKIVVLDNGEIAETGKHQELMEKQGIYFNLYKKMGRI